MSSQKTNSDGELSLRGKGRGGTSKARGVREFKQNGNKKRKKE